MMMAIPVMPDSMVTIDIITNTSFTSATGSNTMATITTPGVTMATFPMTAGTTDTRGTTMIAVIDTTQDPLSGWVLGILATCELQHLQAPGGGPVNTSCPVLPVTRTGINRKRSASGNSLTHDVLNNRELDSFFAQHEEDAFYVAHAALWNKEDALDAVQESMLKLVQYYRNKPQSDWPALFRTILKSKINDIRRKRMLEQGKYKVLSLTGFFKHNSDGSPDNTEYELPGTEHDGGLTAAEIDAVAAEMGETISAALQTLSERQRQVFVLREWRGMTIRETSLTLGCSVNSVKQHHFRALRQLRKELAEVWDHA